MKLAVISDIHSNIEALASVLDDIDGAGADNIIALGDSIGYGADPEKVINLLSIRQIKSVLGNHELALIDRNYLKTFNPGARAALVKNRQMLSEESIKKIQLFNIYCVYYGCRFVHGLPPDSATSYLTFTPAEKLKKIMESLSEKLCFAGHTHLLEITQLKKNKVTRRKITEKTISLDKESRYIINAGSVGQPRDGDSRAKYLIWDSYSDTIEPRYVVYNKLLAAEKIKKSGIPEKYATRLL